MRGVLTCPGGDNDSTHSADVDCAEPAGWAPCDDCGFSPFGDTSTSRATAFAKIRARVPAPR